MNLHHEWTKQQAVWQVRIILKEEHRKKKASCIIVFKCEEYMLYQLISNCEIAFFGAFV